jgi:hypothetical protein
MSAPAWLGETLAEHNRVEGHRDTRAHCACGWKSEEFRNRRLAHNEHLAEEIWKGFEERLCAMPDSTRLDGYGVPDYLNPREYLERASLAAFKDWLSR